MKMTEIAQKELSKYLDLSGERIRQLRQDGIFDGFVSGTLARPKFDSDGCRIAYIRMLRESAQTKKTTPENEQYNEAKTRLTIEQADKAALENQKSRRELIPIDEVTNGLSMLMIEIRTHFQNMPAKLRSRLPRISAKDHKYIESQVAEYLNSCGDEVIKRITD